MRIGRTTHFSRHWGDRVPRCCRHRRGGDPRARRPFMRRTRAFATLSLGCTVGLVVAGVGPASAGGGRGGGDGHGGSSARVVLDTLSSPKGLALDPFGNPVVGQGAFTGPEGAAPIVWVLQGRNGPRTVDITDPLNTIDVALSRDGRDGWALVYGPDGPDLPGGPDNSDGPDAYLYHRALDGTTTEVLDVNTWRLLPGNEDPTD